MSVNSMLCVIPLLFILNPSTKSKARRFALAGLTMRGGPNWPGQLGWGLVRFLRERRVHLGACIERAEQRFVPKSADHP